MLSGQTWVLHMHEILRHFIFRGLSSNSQKVCRLKSICTDQDALSYYFEPYIRNVLDSRASWRHPVVALTNCFLVEQILKRRLCQFLFLGPYLWRYETHFSLIFFL